MKRLSITILLVVSMTLAHSQCQEADIPSWLFSANHKGLTVEFGHITQVTKVGFIFGTTVNLVKENRTSFVYDPELGTNKEINTGETYRRLGGDMHMYGTYMITKEDYSFSLHALAGVVWDYDKGIFPSAGAELRLPAYNKCYFLRVLYPGNYNVGIILRM